MRLPRDCSSCLESRGGIGSGAAEADRMARPIKSPRNVPVGELAARLRTLHATRATLLVAIDGAGGSGKSRLADDIRMRLTASHVPTSIVEVDDFFLPSGRRPRGPASEKPIGGDFDWQRLGEEVLEPLRRGQAARYIRYDWAADEMAGMNEVSPHGVVI